MDFLITTFAVVLAFSVLIFVHELGHFLLARWNDVRVTVFSLGMGPYILSVKRGETTYALSLVPIGGYVKMSGQDDLRPNQASSADPFDYRNKRPGQRAAVLAAGAGFNLIFAFLAFFVCYWVGVRMPAPCVGEVLPGSPIARAESFDSDGKRVPDPLREGDCITMVNGEPMKSLFELQLAVASAGVDRELSIHYARLGADGRYQDAPQPVFVTTRRDTRSGAATVGIEAWTPEEQYRVGFERVEELYAREVPEGTAAARAGLRRGDRIRAVDGEPVGRFIELTSRVDRAKGAKQKMTVEREGQPLELECQAALDAEQHRYLLGFMPAACTRIAKIDPACEAYAQGLREGNVVTEWEKADRGKTLRITFAGLAAHQPPWAEAPERTVSVPAESATATALVLRIRFPKSQEVRAATWGEAAGMAWTDLYRHSVTVFIVLKGLFTRDVSPKALSGFVGIADLTARVATQRDFPYYLWFLGLLSLNLGVLQFVPIPLLDGFHLLLTGIEKVKGSPVSMRVQEVCQYVGLAIIVALLVFVTYQDIMRKFIG